MRRRWMLFAVLAFAPGWAGAGEIGKGKIILEWWDVATLEGNRAGYVHTQVEEIVKDGHTLHVATVELRLTVKRLSDTIQLAMDTGTIETASGKVVGTVMRQLLGKGKELLILGQVRDKELHLTADKKAIAPAPWREDVMGLFRQQLLFQERRVKPGDKFEFASFEPTINLVLKNNVIVKDLEEVELFGGRDKAKLLRVEIHPPLIEKVKLAPMVLWLKDDLLPARSQFEVPGLGNVVLYRTTKANALAPTPIAKLTDVGISQMVRLKRPVKAPHETKAALLRITVKDDADPASTFSIDSRQKLESAKGNVIELEISAGSAKDADEAPAAEHLESSYFIASADEKVKAMARKVVGKEKDAWKKALLIEKWVHNNMKVTGHEALATADHVVLTLEGDCTEFAMLTAAMCRAEGVPSRTAVGLIYADVHVAYAFHMWTEVWNGERWMPLDATLGQGKVGAMHLKIAHHSWHETRNMTPLFPVIRVLGRVQIEVLSVTY